jgi:putative membrane protein
MVDIVARYYAYVFFWFVVGRYRYTIHIKANLRRPAASSAAASSTLRIRSTASLFRLSRRKHLQRCRGFLINAALASTFFAAVGCRQIERVKAESGPSLSESDQDFIVETEFLASRDRALSTFAADKATGGEIQSYARKVIQDDSEALQKLKDLSQVHKVKEHTPAEEHFNDAAKLDNLWRNGLDRQFVNLMIRDEENTIAMYRDEAQRTAAPDLRAYAGNLLPAFQSELKQGRDLQRKMSAAAASQIRLRAGKSNVRPH